MRLLLLTASLVLAVPAHAQTVDLPDTIVNAEPIALSLTGLPPGRRITIEADRRDADGAAYRSAAAFLVPPSGVVDLGRDAPVGGSYAGADRAGLFWSMRPQRGSTQAAASLIVRALDGDTELARDEARIVDSQPGVRMEEVPGFAGARLYRPDRAGVQPGRLPVIILLGGSEGGSGFGRRMGPIFAARGFAALALPYHNPGWSGEQLPGLPQAFVDIPVDRLDAVRAWIARQDGLDHRRIGIHGVSKGAEFAMIAASRMPWLRAVSAIVPSDVIWEGWGDGSGAGVRGSFAWRGRPLSFVPYVGMEEAIAALGRGERRSLSVPHLEGRRANPGRAAAARIPIERFRGALLVAGGDLDTVWPSGEMVRAIAERRAAAGLDTTALGFAGAGHSLAQTGWSPIDYEGRPVPATVDAAAQHIVHAAVLAFFERTLNGI